MAKLSSPERELDFTSVMRNERFRNTRITADELSRPSAFIFFQRLEEHMMERYYCLESGMNLPRRNLTRWKEEFDTARDSSRGFDEQHRDADDYESPRPTPTEKPPHVP